MVFDEKWGVTHQKSLIFYFLFVISIQTKNKKCLIFDEASIFHFWVLHNPIFIKISRFHAPRREKDVAKVILISLPGTQKCNRGICVVFRGSGTKPSSLNLINEMFDKKNEKKCENEQNLTKFRVFFEKN